MNINIEEIGTIPLADGKIVARICDDGTHSPELELILCHNKAVLAPARYRLFHDRNDALEAFSAFDSILEYKSNRVAMLILDALDYTAAPFHQTRKELRP